MKIIVNIIVAAVILTYVTSEAFYVHKIRDLNSTAPKIVQFCRKSCLKKFINEKTLMRETIDKCSENSMCFMCWDYCGLLYHESRIVTVSMCSDFVCYSGCKTACTYYTMIHKENLSSTDDVEVQKEIVMGNSVHHQQPMEAKLLMTRN